jgi:hypothetical protein
MNKSKIAIDLWINGNRHLRSDQTQRDNSDSDSPYIDEFAGSQK